MDGEVGTREAPPHHVAMVVPVPEALLRGPFTIAQADVLGYPRGALRRSCWVGLFRGVYVHRELERTAWVWAAGALLTVLPEAAAVVTHRTAAVLYGFDPGGWGAAPWELSVRGPTHSRVETVRLHRRIGDLDEDRYRAPLPISGPERTIVDCALRATLVQTVQLMEHMMRAGHTTRERLFAYLGDCHLHGVVAAREAFELVRERSESVRETWLRLLLVLAGLPEPEVNVDVRTPDGVFVARVDLLYRRWKVVVEYDGRHHETDARQWARDRRRREALEALGYRVIVVAAADAKHPQDVVRRVHRALVARGYAAERYWFSPRWIHLFAGGADPGRSAHRPRPAF